ncbi:aminotransferase class I/II-fold pyridoxal phosphate-dependent enzyme [soil metagenome]
MAAVAAVLEDIGVGERVVVAQSAYVEVRRLLVERQAAGKLEVVAIDPTATDELLAAIPGAALVWIDAISNPTLDIPDLVRIAAAANQAGATLLVDATLATPMLLRPLELGADLVLHSATKYIGGHSDMLLGVVAARDPRMVERLHKARTTLGAVPGTMETFLGLRGLRTLPLRLERGQAGAALLAERLAAHPEVQRVRYPGLPSDPSHEEATRLLDGFGAMLSFEALGGTARADAICSKVRVLTHATSLGGVESLIERHSRWHAEPAVPEALLRVSVGCEHPEDLWYDLEQALELSRT